MTFQRFIILIFYVGYKVTNQPFVSSHVSHEMIAAAPRLKRRLITQPFISQVIASESNFFKFFLTYHVISGNRFVFADHQYKVTEKGKARSPVMTAS